MAQIMFNPKETVATQPKPMPIILMLDTSDSMDIVTNPDEVRRTGRYGFRDGHHVEEVEGGITRISILNKAVKKMLNTFAKYEREATDYLVAIITFGEDTRLMLPPSAASDVRFAALEAKGETPLGKALEIAKKLIEDDSQIPSRAYRPVVILVSDGEPTDSWQTPLDDFIKNGRTAKCDRMALAISHEADRAMLAKFIEGTNRQVFEADNAEEIIAFFKYATISTIKRAQSQNPNFVPKDEDMNSLSPTPSKVDQTSSPAPQAPESQDDDNDEWVW